MANDLDAARKYFYANYGQWDDAKEWIEDTLDLMKTPRLAEINAMIKKAYGPISDEEIWELWAGTYSRNQYTPRQIVDELKSSMRKENIPPEKEKDMAMLAAAPLALEGIGSLLGPELLASLGGAEGVKQIANLVYSKGGKKMISDVLDKAKSLVGSKEGRAKLLRGAGRVGDVAFHGISRGAQLLAKTPLIKHSTADMISGTVGKAHRGFQSALGSLSKAGKAFAFL